MNVSNSSMDFHPAVSEKFLDVVDDGFCTHGVQYIVAGNQVTLNTVGITII